MLDMFSQEDSDLENYLTVVQEDMMEFKLSYEMWRVGRWAVTIPHVSPEYGPERAAGLSSTALLELILKCCVCARLTARMTS